MSQQAYELAETRLEERDGALWVTGLCPVCWDRLAFHAPPRGSNVEVQCPNGHPLRIFHQRSEGRDGPEGLEQTDLLTADTELADRANKTAQGRPTFPRLNGDSTLVSAA